MPLSLLPPPLIVSMCAFVLFSPPPSYKVLNLQDGVQVRKSSVLRIHKSRGLPRPSRYKGKKGRTKNSAFRGMKLAWYLTLLLQAYHLCLMMKICGDILLFCTQPSVFQATLHCIFHILPLSGKLLCYGNTCNTTTETASFSHLLETTPLLLCFHTRLGKTDPATSFSHTTSLWVGWFVNGGGGDTLDCSIFC